ncbi:MAG TPA: TraM recognition domain-containing protein, partial [Rhabdaerophilum sp.]|nr:TraM recognition domain-containing protein [Rhabdaerophilum sp.]
ELANLPRMPVLEKAARLYRGYGLQFWGFVQGRHSLESAYGKTVAKDLEDGAEVLQLFSVEDAGLLRDVETWSGSQEVTLSGTSASVGTDSLRGGQNSSSSVGQNQHKRSVLQSEDIRTMGWSEQILRVAGQPLFRAGRVP